MSDVDELMEYIRDELEDINQSVEFLRDEAKLQLHLAKADVREEWDALENKFSDYQHKMELVRDEIARDNDEVFDIARTLGKELLNSYERIKGIIAA